MDYHYGGGGPDNHTHENISDYYKQPTNEFMEPLAATASFLGMASIGCAFVLPFFIPVILGGIAIILAILSRGRETRFLPTAKRAVIMSLIGMGIHIVMVCSVFFTAYRSLQDPQLRAQVSATMQQVYGYSLNDMLHEIEALYGISLEGTFVDDGTLGHASSGDSDVSKETDAPASTDSYVDPTQIQSHHVPSGSETMDDLSQKHGPDYAAAGGNLYA